MVVEAESVVVMAVVAATGVVTEMVAVSKSDNFHRLNIHHDFIDQTMLELVNGHLAI